MAINNKRIVALLIAILSSCVGYSENHGDESFTYEKETFAGFGLGYRKAEIDPNGDSEGIVVIYLHGGSGQGDDNRSQLMTQAVEDIYDYLKSNDVCAVFLVPQAPYGCQWTGDLIPAVKALLDKYSLGGNKEVYVLGGSMGGYGVWNMLAAYPGFFSGAMPVACDTPGKSPENYRNTKIFSVVGRNDPRRNIERIKSFFEDLSERGIDAKIDIEADWNHRQICEWSFTPERLDWLFSKNNPAID